MQHRYADIVNWYEELASNNPTIVKYVASIGKSVEGRDQPAVHIAAAGGNGNKIYFQCQIHASKTQYITYCLYFCFSGLITNIQYT